MIFQNIAIKLANHIEDNIYQRDFEFRLNFITAYLSFQIRTYKHEADVSGLIINVGGDISEKDCYFPFFTCSISFDKIGYENAAMNRDFGYYCQLIRAGLNAANGHYRIPTKKLLDILDEFEMGNYVHSWNYKSKTFKEHNLRAKFICNYTTDAFSLDAHFYNISSKKELCNGTVFRTLPDSIFFTRSFKNIIEENNYILITEYDNGYPLVYISIDLILQGVFNFAFANGDGLETWELDGLKRLKKNLAFEGNSFYYGIPDEQDE